MIDAVKEFQENHAIQMEADEIPIIVSAIKSMPENGLMVEWGSGASTIRWAQEMSGNQRLISIEHNVRWYSIVYPIIMSDKSLSDRVKYYFCPTNGYYDHGYGGLTEENPIGLDRYFYPDLDMYDADVFLIDGVARGACAQMILHKATKDDPVIFMHDWYRRALWYSWSIQFFGSHQRVGSTLCRMRIRDKEAT